MDGLNVSDFLIEVARQKIEGKITMNEAQTLINEHYTHMKSNRSSYEIIPPNSEESKRIADSTKPNDRIYINNVLVDIVPLSTVDLLVNVMS